MSKEINCALIIKLNLSCIQSRPERKIFLIKFDVKRLA